MHAQVVLNNLYKYTALQMRFPVNAVALVNGTPQTLSLKEFLVNFLEFRCEVVKRRARHGSTPLVMPLLMWLAVDRYPDERARTPCITCRQACLAHFLLWRRVCSGSKQFGTVTLRLMLQVQSEEGAEAAAHSGGPADCYA